MFTIANWACISSSLNQGQLTVTPFGGSPTVENAQNLFVYASPTDTVATIEASNYFLTQFGSLSVGDTIIVNGTDASIMLIVTASTSTSVTTTSFTPTGSVGTSNIVNNAVTYAKLQQASAGDVLLANPTGSAANYEEITLGNGLSFSGTTLQVNLGLSRQTTVALTLAQFVGMYATPVQLLAAPGAGLMNVIDSIYVNLVYGSAQLAAGGAVGAQYGATIHGAGPAASATEAATDYTSAIASTLFRIGGGVSTGAVTSTAINTAIYLSNATAAFTTGTGGSFSVIVNYRTISAT